MPRIAKVRFPSPLTQLDKEFDYLVPEKFESTIVFGSLVEVPFGKGGKFKQGIVCGVSSESEHLDKLLSIESIISNHPVLTERQLELCKHVATRQAGTVGELLATSLPKRSVRVDKSFNSNVDLVHMETLSTELTLALQQHERLLFLPKLISGDGSIPNWAIEFASACLNEYSSGRSSLVVLPDYRDLVHFESALTKIGLLEVSYRHSSSDTGSTRFLNYLKATTQIGINYGLRGAAFSPALNLGLSLLWDDGDDSHTDQSSPYWNSRDVLLQRAELENCKLVISSHAPSEETLRLVEIGYLHSVKVQSPVPLGRVTTSHTRLDEETHALISRTLNRGRPVLVQISNAGWASGVACVRCKEPRLCPNCSGKVWIDPLGLFRCRQCKLAEVLTACACGSIQTKPIRVGASAIANQLQIAFPTVSVVKSTGEERILKVEASGLLIVATPGSEPDVPGGYECVIFADAYSMIGSPRLRALEKTVSRWANATSLCSRDAQVVFVGLTDRLADQARSLDFMGMLQDDYRDRIEIGLPPATRIASIVASNSTDFINFKKGVLAEFEAGRVKKLPSEVENTLVLDYQYSIGLELASFLKALSIALTQKSKHKKPGQRVFRINMDDSKVI